MNPKSVAAFAAAITMTVGFTALGLWQVERRAWKHDLISRVTQRVAAPVSPPPADWRSVGTQRDEYRHVRLSGTWLHDRSTRVQAVTGLGSGFWLMTPLRAADGSVVLVNRGFVEARTGEASGCGPGEVTGLLRITEPGGGFLRRNDPASDRWYSRDVAAIASARGLANVAPYFVDAAAGPADAASNCPIGGLTVIDFHDNHLVYALTWFALALMSAAGLRHLVRSGSEVVQDASMNASTPDDARTG